MWTDTTLLDRLRDAMRKQATPKIPVCVDCGLFPPRARGLCARCYLRYYRTQKPMPRPHAKKQGKFKDPAKMSERECRCDCVNCVTGNHGNCYYRPTICPWSDQLL